MGKAVRSYRLAVLEPLKGKGITKHAFYHTFSCLQGVIRTALDRFVVTSHSSAYCKRNDSQLANNLIDLSAHEWMDAGEFEPWAFGKNPVDSAVVQLELVWIPHLHPTKIQISKPCSFHPPFSQTPHSV